MVGADALLYIWWSFTGLSSPSTACQSDRPLFYQPLTRPRALGAEACEIQTLPSMGPQPSHSERHRGSTDQPSGPPFLFSFLDGLLRACEGTVIADFSASSPKSLGDQAAPGSSATVLLAPGV